MHLFKTFLEARKYKKYTMYSQNKTSKYGNWGKMRTENLRGKKTVGTHCFEHKYCSPTCVTFNLKGFLASMYLSGYRKKADLLK